jgi:hypothetical protein
MRRSRLPCDRLRCDLSPRRDKTTACIVPPKRTDRDGKRSLATKRDRTRTDASGRATTASAPATALVRTATRPRTEAACIRGVRGTVPLSTAAANQGTPVIPTAAATVNKLQTVHAVRTLLLRLVSAARIRRHRITVHAVTTARRRSPAPVRTPPPRCVLHLRAKDTLAARILATVATESVFRAEQERVSEGCPFRLQIPSCDRRARKLSTARECRELGNRST